ncbi:MAG: hypothetical protein WAW88_07275 [Nocardioides sp.]
MNDAVVLAHGLGGRSDLPVPLWTAVYGAVAALLFSFAALSLFWHAAKFEDDGGKPLPAGIQSLLNSKALALAGRALGLVMFLVIMSTAWLGSPDVRANPTPAWFYVWLWCGLVPLSLLFGPVIAAMNPLRTIAGLIGRGEGEPIPASWGMYPAALSILSFVWLELVMLDPAAPRTVAAYLTIYSVIHIALGARYGQKWFAQGEGFEVYSTLIGRLSPLGRSEDGTWVLRNPLRGLATTPTVNGLVAVVCVLLGSTAFDGITRTPFWKSWARDFEGGAYLASGTAGLLGAILVVYAIYMIAMRMTKPWVPDRPALAEDFVHSLVPIAVGYTVAHYFSFVVFDGQLGLIRGSDPYAKGWDLLGTADNSINYTIVSTAVIAIVQVAAIALGHITGVFVAHDRAVALFPKRFHQLAQYPLLAAMVSFTMAGIALVVGSKDAFWLLVTVAVFIPTAALFVWILAPVEDPLEETVG